LKEVSVVVCDYGIGNLHNVFMALEFLKIDYTIDKDGNQISKGDLLLIPGVAAFGEGIRNLKKFKQFEQIKKYSDLGKPIVGLCLGAQMLFENSEEAKLTSGLNLIEGNVLSLENKIKRFPNQGWYKLRHNDHSNFQLNTDMISQFYFFSHSYYMAPRDNSLILTSIEIGNFKVPALIKDENKAAIQFHPERSGVAGLKFLNFVLNYMIKNN